MTTKTVLGIVGCGAIGNALVGRFSGEKSNIISGIVIYDRDENISKALSDSIPGLKIASNMDDMAIMSDIMIEAANPEAAIDTLRRAIEKKKDVMIMSIGGLLGQERLFQKAAKEGISVILPSGALGGIDAVKAARIAGIDSVTLTTRKPPNSLKGAPYLSAKNIDIDSLKEETIIFEGNALDAVKAFPKNINVSALLSIVGLGPVKTKVRIIVSPEYTRNIHEIHIESKAGTFTFRTENVPFPSNPKTSYLAALSAMSALEEYLSLKST